MDDKKVIQNTLENAEGYVAGMEALDEQTEKERKRLKRKVVLRNVVIAGLVIVIIILLLRGCGGGTSPDGEKSVFKPVLQNGELVFYEPVEENKERDSSRVLLPVITNFSVSSTQPAVVLYNPEDNAEKFYIYYIFTDTETGEVIFQSNAVEAGFYWSVNFKELLDVGTHDVKVTIRSQYADTGAFANGSVSNIKITVNE